jgi:hypothetical protein
MNPATRFLPATALLTLLAAGPSQACMPMPFASTPPGCAGERAAAPAPAACPRAAADTGPGCGGQAQELATIMGGMAGNGMNMAMTMMSAIFGTPPDAAR